MAKLTSKELNQTVDFLYAEVMRICILKSIQKYLTSNILYINLYIINCGSLE